MIEWLEVAPNPDWQGPWPDREAGRCHDGTGYLEVMCPCGTAMHIHRSQIADMPHDADIVTRCSGCARMLGMEGKAVLGAIDLMWAR